MLPPLSRPFDILMIVEGMGYEFAISRRSVSGLYLHSTLFLLTLKLGRTGWISTLFLYSQYESFSLSTIIGSETDVVKARSAEP